MHRRLQHGQATLPCDPSFAAGDDSALDPSKSLCDMDRLVGVSDPMLPELLKVEDGLCTEFLRDVLLSIEFRDWRPTEFGELLGDDGFRHINCNMVLFWFASRPRMKSS